MVIILQEITILPQVLVNVKVNNNYKEKLLSIESVAKTAEIIEKKYADTGRLLLRPSGTEPLVRIMIEGQDYTEIEKDANELAKVIEDAMLELV